MYPLKQSSTAQPLVFYMVDSSDHIAAKTGLTCTVTIRKAGGSFASPGGAVTEIANGWYQVAGNATDTNTLGPLLLHSTSTGADPSDVCYHVVAYDPQDSVRIGITALPNAAAGANGGLPTGDANARVDVIKIAGTTQTARDLGASVLLSAGTGTGQLDFTSGVVKANLVQILATALTETAGQIAAAFKKWFDVASPVGTVNSIPNATAGAAGGLFIAGSNAATTANITGNLTGNVTGSVGSVTGAVGSVTGNVGGNVTGSVGSLTTNNDKTGYALSAGGVTAVQSGLATSAALATVQADTDDIQTRLPAALSGGRMDSVVNAMATGVVTAAAVATNAIDADALAADAVTEIAAGVSVGSAPTAAQNAAAVWNEAIAGHLSAGTTGAKLNGLSGASGSGAITHVITVTSGGNPVDGALVWVTTDSAGANVVASGFTDALGHVTVFLDAGTYYQWAQRGGINFANGQSAVVA